MPIKRWRETPQGRQEFVGGDLGPARNNLYYYALVQVPTYEFLPALGMLLAIFIGIRHKLWMALPGSPFKRADEAAMASASAATGEPGEGVGESQAETGDAVPAPGAGPSNPLALWLEHVKVDQPAPAGSESDEAWQVRDERLEEPFEEDQKPLPLLPVPTLALLTFWSLSSLVAFSVAGERMPWLTVHIALPMVLAAGWGVGYLVETTHWADLRKNHGWLVTLLGIVFLVSLAGGLAALLGPNPPFQGKTIDQLQSTSLFITSLLMVIASGYGLLRLLIPWEVADIRRLAVFIFFGFLSILTIRTAIRAAYVNYDTALEFLVYAHTARGPRMSWPRSRKFPTGSLAVKISWWRMIMTSIIPSGGTCGITPTRCTLAINPRASCAMTRSSWSAKPNLARWTRSWAMLMTNLTPCACGGP